MTHAADELPRFVREALTDDFCSAEVAEALALLDADLPPIATGTERLAMAVESLPLRYAPFYSSLSELWALSELAVVRALTHAADPRAWRRAALPGVRSVEITPGPRLSGARVSLTRFRPGLVFPRHVHEGPEALLVLEGRYEDASGRSVGPGDLHEMPAHSEHSVRVAAGEPCVVAAVHFGLRFTGPLLGVLSKLFR